jgi:hypothetical protein
MQISVPTETRVSKDKVGDLVPVDAFFTAPYGCVAGKATMKGPTWTYKFRGQDLGLECDVLVRTANAFADFQYRADRIVNEGIQSRLTLLREERKDIVYKLETLPEDVQAKIFGAMEVDWELEKLVGKTIRRHLEPIPAYVSLLHF